MVYLVIALVLIWALTRYLGTEKKDKDSSSPQWDPYDADVRNFYRKRK